MFCNGVLAITHGNSYDVLGIAKLYFMQKRYTLLWFLTCLFLAEQCMFLLERLYLKFESKKAYWLVVCCIEFILYYLYRTQVGIEFPWNADLVLIGLTFMSLGKYIREIDFMNKLQKYQLLLGSVLIFLCISFSWYNYVCFEKVDWYSNQYGNFALYLLSACTGVFGMIILASKMECSSLSLLGRNSLIFYGLYRLIIDNLVFVIYPKSGIQMNEDHVFSLILAIVSIFIAIIILDIFNCFVERYIPWCIGKKRRGK